MGMNDINSLTHSNSFFWHHRRIGIAAGDLINMHDFICDSEDGWMEFHRGIMHQTSNTGLANGSRDVCKILMREFWE